MAGLGARSLDAVLIAVGSPHPIAARVASFAGVPPLGTAYVAAALREKGIRVRIADLNVPGWTRGRLGRLLALQRPGIAGISCTTESYRNAIRLGAWLKRSSPAIRVVVGGPHVTFEDEAALRTGAFDVVVRGEGERTAAELFPRLLDGVAADPSIRGISYAEAGGIVRTAARERIEDLDSLPLPARDLLPMERYGSPGAILTGRGCPGRCPFCSASAMAGGRYRTRGEEGVLDEIALLARAGWREIVFLDDTLTGDRPRLERLLAGLEARRLPISWTCESRIEAVDPSLLRRMARSGCHAIQFGVESGSLASRERLGKGAAGIEDLLRATDRAGITPIVSLILGLPWEDEAAVRETIALGLRLQRDFLAQVGFGVLVCFPGTPFWRHGPAFGLRRRTGDFDAYTMHIPTCDTPYLDRAALRSLHLEAVMRQVREAPRGLLALSRPPDPWREEGTRAGTGDRA